MKINYPIKNNVLAFYRGIFSQWYGGFRDQDSKHTIDASEWLKFMPNWLAQDSFLSWIDKEHDCSADIHTDLIDKNTFNCCEQSMMFGKAVVFGDYEIAKRILEEFHPGKIQNLGRSVKNFDVVYWDKIKLDLVEMINLHKFRQNPELGNELKSTSHLILTEASNDLIWGCGFSSDQPETYDVTKWRGQNLLGRVLMRVREKL